MGKKRAAPHRTAGARRRADAAAAARASARRAPPPRRSGRVARALIYTAIAFGAVIVVGTAANVLGGNHPAATPSATARSATVEASSRGGSALVGGGPLATKLVAVLHADPFRAHIEETTVARSTAGNVTVRLTAKAVGDVSGKDVALHVTSTGAGAPVDREVVSLGSATWIRDTGATTWDVHRRSDAAQSIDGLLDTIRLIEDPSELADAGTDTVEGQALHHLTAVGSIAYRSPDGADGAYDRLDVWTTDAGIPVLVQGSFSASEGVNALVGNVTIRYSDVGKPVTITAPSGAPTPIP